MSPTENRKRTAGNQADQTGPGNRNQRKHANDGGQRIRLRRNNGAGLTRARSGG